MAKEFDKAGITTVHITTLALLSQGVGANRIVAAKAIPNPTGDASLDKEAEYSLRRDIVENALALLQREVNGPTILYPKSL